MVQYQGVRAVGLGRSWAFCILQAKMQDGHSFRRRVSWASDADLVKTMGEDICEVLAAIGDDVADAPASENKGPPQPATPPLRDDAQARERAEGRKEDDVDTTSPTSSTFFWDLSWSRISSLIDTGLADDAANQGAPPSTIDVGGPLSPPRDP